jgi:hypothetical protein
MVEGDASGLAIDGRCSIHTACRRRYRQSRTDWRNDPDLAHGGP